ncbi:MAG: hypothetical protein KDB61_13245, partial [Planctomycetes bacterium]|nr:hypothetical protein [Planctomycetota bacterium]
HGNNRALGQMWGLENLFDMTFDNGAFFSVQIDGVSYSGDPMAHADQIRRVVRNFLGNLAQSNVVERAQDDLETLGTSLWNAAMAMYSKLSSGGGRYAAAAQAAFDFDANLAPRSEGAVRYRTALRYVYDRATRTNPVVESVRQELLASKVDPTPARVSEVLRRRSRGMDTTGAIKAMGIPSLGFSAPSTTTTTGKSSGLHKSPFVPCEQTAGEHGANSAQTSCLPMELVPTGYSETGVPLAVLDSARRRAQGPFPLGVGYDLAENRSSFHLRQISNPDPGSCLEATEYCTPCGFCTSCLWLDRFLGVLEDSLDIGSEYYAPGGVFSRSLAKYNHFLSAVQNESQAATAKRHPGQHFPPGGQGRRAFAAGVERAAKQPPKWMARRGLTWSEFKGSGVSAVLAAARRSPDLWSSLRNLVSGPPGGFLDRFLRR